MARFRWIWGVVAVSLTAYAAWPLLGLKRIADAVDSKDAGKFVDLLHIPELKRSLAAQIVRTQLNVLKPDKQLSPLAFNLAMQAGIAVADSYVLEIIKSQRLFDLLKSSGIQVISRPNAATWSWGPPNIRRAGQLLGAAKYRGTNFYVTIPLSAEAKQQYRLRLMLSQWEWKLAGIELPEDVQVRLARELEAFATQKGS